ncbi:hypothetical protein B0H16DRAFT_583662 [Mycena metata]|uniref:Uncharacterized protein n=1 Tax=Mycena metata TaxID=1033252 RepID=A0AAD7H4Y7_9AGAR|nr:hypothetical protein B0H16DRAFT_583662 [Mycena metata]
MGCARHHSSGSRCALTWDAVWRARVEQESRALGVEWMVFRVCGAVLWPAELLSRMPMLTYAALRRRAPLCCTRRRRFSCPLAGISILGLHICSICSQRAVARRAGEHSLTAVPSGVVSRIGLSRFSGDFLFVIVVCDTAVCGRLDFLASEDVVRGAMECQMCVIVECAAESAVDFSLVERCFQLKTGHFSYNVERHFLTDF